MRWNIFENKNKIKIGKKTLPLKPMSLEEAVNFIFILFPYIKLIKRSKEEYKTENNINHFSFIVSTLVDELDKETLYKAISLLLHQPIDVIKTIESKDIYLALPKLIRANNLIELYYIFKNLGAFE